MFSRVIPGSVLRISSGRLGGPYEVLGKHPTHCTIILTPFCFLISEFIQCRFFFNYLPIFVFVFPYYFLCCLNFFKFLLFFGGTLLIVFRDYFCSNLRNSLWELILNCTAWCPGISLDLSHAKLMFSSLS